MKTTSHQFSRAVVRAVVTMATAATIVLAPSFALAARTSSEDRAEARIAHMHAKLDITSSQEEQWAKVAEVMRDNARSMDSLMQTRHENAKSMNAVDDLISYGEITDAHADGIKKLTPVFATLYADMSDAQKAEADTLFRHGDHKKGKRR
jgi:protein CpxP